MKHLNCKNCGAPMLLDASGMTAVCHYCGTKYVLNHEDTDYFRGFYRRMTEFLSGGADEQARRLKADALWQDADEQAFECTDGSRIEIKYMYSYTLPGVEVYVARRNIIFHFLTDGAAGSERFRRAVSLLDYPSADTRSLQSFFPTISGGFELCDGTCVLVVSKDMDEYPLCLFGNLPGRHVAWIISRMENLCCVLEYNALVHPAINVNSLYINPYTHQASLYGGWWEADRRNTATRGGVLKTEQNLTALRDTAANLLGYAKAGEVRVTDDVPKALADFINSKPRGNAYDDFAYWDEMLIKAYGERKFISMNADDEQIYGNAR